MSQQNDDAFSDQPQDEHSGIDPFGGPDPTLEDPAERALAGGPAGPVRMKHPEGLWVLFITEMWERFSYYGMRAILVLYLVAGTAEVLQNGVVNTNPGFGWTEANAYILYGTYTFMVYLTAIFGGAIADRFLGTHRSMLVGGWIIAAGHITLACTEFFGVTPGQVVSLQTSPGALVTFLTGLALIIVGTGFFKPCVSVMVGQLYGENDPRRDSGFTIFYMGINLGALMSPLIAGSLGELVGWHWGFGSAAVGMIVGLIFYQIFRPKYLEGIGLPPAKRERSGRSGLIGFALTGALVGIPAVPMVLYVGGGLEAIQNAWSSIAGTPQQQVMVAVVVAAVLVGAIIAFLLAQKPEERAPLGVIFILAFLGNIFFWTAFEQAGSSLNVFAKQDTDRTLWGLLERDDLVQTVHLEAEITEGSAFALAFEGRRSADIVVGTSTADDLEAFIAELAPSLEIETPHAGVVTPGDVLTITVEDARAAAEAAGIEKPEPPVAIVPPRTRGDGSASVSVAVKDDEGFPASWYQSVNPFCILIFAPVFAWLWVWLDKRRFNPSTPLKFALGLWLLGIAFLAMIAGALEAQGGLAGAHWLLITYVLCTWGELCLSPIGLSMVTKLAPARLQSFMMGVWFFTFALSNLLAGLVAFVSTKFKPDPDTGAPAEMAFLGYEGLPGFFVMLVVFPIGMGVVIAILSPILRRMMHGVK